MSGSEKNMDKIFRGKLNHYDAEPPAEVWNNINDKLNQDRRRTGIFWITRIAAGIAILTVLSLSSLLIRNVFNNKLITSDEGKVEKSTEESVPVISEKQDEEKISTKEYEQVQIAAAENILQFTGEKQNPTVVEQNIIVSDEGSVKDELTISGSSLSFMEGKYIGQLEYEITEKQAIPSETGKSGKSLQENKFPAETIEDSYALNIPVEDENKDGKWGIGTQFSPLYSYRTLEIDEQSLMSASYYNEAESGMMAYSGGINVNYGPTRRISLQSGVYYSKYGLTVDNAYYYENAVPDATASGLNTKFYSVNNSSGEIDVMSNSSTGYITNFADRSAQYANMQPASELSDKVDNGEIIQNFEYIEVPLIVKYKVIDRKLGFNFLGGLSTNLLVGSNAYYNEDGNQEKIGETTDIKPFNYSSILGVGLSYSVSERFNINLEPTFRYYLNSINESSVVKSHPYSMGIFTGLSYYF
jgi:hypothetical protein